MKRSEGLVTKTHNQEVSVLCCWKCRKSIASSGCFMNYIGNQANKVSTAKSSSSFSRVMILTRTLTKYSSIPDLTFTLLTYRRYFKVIIKRNLTFHSSSFCVFLSTHFQFLGEKVCAFVLRYPLMLCSWDLGASPKDIWLTRIESILGLPELPNNAQKSQGLLQ